jgi:hypothetical protein
MMRIKTELDLDAPAPLAWCAWDEDTYDGAPDAGARARAQGRGATKEAAVADLQEQLEE